MAVCFYHGDRPGVGLCVRCRKVICSACCTRLEGINHCHRCLAELGRRTAKRREPNSALAALTLIALLCAAFFLILRLAQGSLF